jgi:hypothetical protein
MANKPTVTLTFAGDSSKLEKAFEGVGASATEMTSKMKSASDDARTAGAGIEEMTDKADVSRVQGYRASPTRFQAFREHLRASRTHP